MTDKTILAVWDYDDDKLVWFKVYDEKSEDYEIDGAMLDKKYFLTDDERYDVTDEPLLDGESIDDILRNHPKWKESVDKHGWPNGNQKI